MSANSNNNTDNNTAGGITFLGLFFLVLFVLKIIGTLTWSWWWITAPLWGPLGLVALVLGGIGFVLVAGKAKNSLTKAKRSLTKRRLRIR